MKLLLAKLFFFSLVGCASSAMAEEMAADEPLPTPDEVIAHVRAQWNEDYSQRFARFASRPGEMAELLAVTDVACFYYFGVPDCTFEVTARFEGEAEQRREISENFGRDADGRLQSVIVSIHVHPMARDPGVLVPVVRDGS
jgi:hypothetical protein